MSILLTIASIYFTHFDYDLTHYLRNLNNGGLLNTLFTYVTLTGDITFMVFIIIALFVGGARKEALVFAIVFIVVNLLALSLKYVIARPRPGDLGVIPEAEASFPSAHAGNVFALATTISRYHRKFTIVMFAWAVAVAFSRVFLGLHYVTDVIGGAVLGFVVSYVITGAALRRDDLVSAFARHPVAFIRRLRYRSRRCE